MATVRSEHTQPELIVRRLIHRLGYRFRLHRVDLPGKPDLVFPGRRAVIFVDGCFWHGHRCNRGRRRPVNNADYWLNKIRRNQTRDRRVKRELEQLGWRVLRVWECQLKSVDMDRLTATLRDFLDQQKARPVNTR